VYGASAPGHDGSARPVSAPASLENTGSLTGHILAQGRPDLQEERTGSARLVVIIMAVVGILVVGGLAAAIAFLSGVFS
jgi:hypothetical protein